MRISKNNFRGCILGGAAADAKGYNAKSGGKELISDNTQLMSFTLDGIVWADDRAIRRGVYAYIPCMFYSYQKWYYTQTGNLADKSYEFILKGEILDWEELFARRGTGETTLTALAGSIGNKYGTLKNRINNSKGCGGIVRVAPIGLYFWKNEDMAFKMAMESAALTHGHTDAILSSGFYAALIADLVSGAELNDAVDSALNCLKKNERHEVCCASIQKAVKLAGSRKSPLKCIQELGDGHSADEAAAIAVFIILRYKDDFQGAISTATGFPGNTNSVPPLVGGALGAYLGQDVIPKKWINTVELYDLFIYGADLLLERVDIEDSTE